MKKTEDNLKAKFEKRSGEQEIKAYIKANGKAALVILAVIVAIIVLYLIIKIVSNNEDKSEAINTHLQSEISDFIETVDELKIEEVKIETSNDDNKNKSDVITLNDYLNCYNIFYSDISDSLCSIPEQTKTDDGKNELNEAAKIEQKQIISRQEMEKIIEHRQNSYSFILNTGSREVSNLLANNCMAMITYDGVDKEYYLSETNKYFWEALSYDNTLYDGSSNFHLLYDFGNFLIYATQYDNEESISLYHYITGIVCLDKSLEEYNKEEILIENGIPVNSKLNNTTINKDDINFVKIDAIGKIAEKHGDKMSDELKKYIYDEYDKAYREISSSFKNYTKAMSYHSDFVSKYNDWND